MQAWIQFLKSAGFPAAQTWGGGGGWIIAIPWFMSIGMLCIHWRETMVIYNWLNQHAVIRKYL